MKINLDTLIHPPTLGNVQRLSQMAIKTSPQSRG